MSIACSGTAVPAPERRAGSVRPPASGEHALGAAAWKDPDAFESLYRAHYPRVVGYLYRRTGDAHASEDLAAQTFIAAWKALPRYRDTGAPLIAWLLRIATNESHRWLRRAARRRAFEGAQARVASLGAADEREEVRRAIGLLPLAQQDVIALVYFESMSMEQAAEVLRVRTGTIKSRLARARAALAAELKRREVL